MRWSLMLAWLAPLALVSTAEASPAGAPGLEFGGYVFHGSFDEESNVEDDEGLGGRLGIVFVPQHEMEFSFDFVSTEDDVGAGLEVDLSTFKTGYVLNFVPGGAVSPFFTAGLGVQFVQISDETVPGEPILTEQADPLAFGGFGVRFYIGRVFNIRLDAVAQAVFPDGDLDDTLLDGIFMAGFGWTLGPR